MPVLQAVRLSSVMSRRGLNRVSLGEPTRITTGQWNDTGDSQSSQSQRHTGARGFVWSSAVEDDIPIAWNLGMPGVQILGSEAQRSGNLGAIGVQFRVVAQIQDGDVLSRLHPAPQLFGGNPRHGEVSQVPSAAEPFPAQVSADHADHYHRE